MWQCWPEAEMQHDLDVVRVLGFNCVRFFLRWQDFEPWPGRYEPLMFARLAQFLRWCAERDLLAHPSLFVGWMSGGTFWPRWREERNVFADPFMVERAAAFAARAAEVIALYHEHVLAVDQGNELCCLSDNHTAPPLAVYHWCDRVNQAVRSVYPQALIISGNEQNQLTADTGWRFGAQPGTDLYSMHGYPVPNWHSLPFDGMTDPLCQSLLPFYTRVARAFGPVLVQEFGTIVTFGAAQQESYLRAVLPGCWEAGANGFLWWCLRDISAPVHPYLKNSFEGTLGLVDAQDRVKPGLEFFLEFARTLPTRPAPVTPEDAIGLYWPKHYYPRDNALNPGNLPRQLSRWLVMANHLLRTLGHAVTIVRGDQPLDPALRTLLVPGAFLGGDEAEALAPWVEGGGRLLWHGPDPMNMGQATIHLLGAKPVNYRAARPAEVCAFGEGWALSHYPRQTCTEMAPDGAVVIATDGRGLPLLLRHRCGAGVVVWAIPQVEEEAAALADLPPERDRWVRWYAGLLGLADR
jgi:hypothetical protein